MCTLLHTARLDSSNCSALRPTGLSSLNLRTVSAGTRTSLPLVSTWTPAPPAAPTRTPITAPFPPPAIAPRMESRAARRLPLRSACSCRCRWRFLLLVRGADEIAPASHRDRFWLLRGGVVRRVDPRHQPLYRRTGDRTVPNRTPLFRPHLAPAMSPSIRS
jgi:hypothetical protein